MQISAIRRPASMPPRAAMPPSTMVAPTAVRDTRMRRACASRHSLATSGCASRPTLGHSEDGRGSSTLLIVAPGWRSSADSASIGVVAGAHDSEDALGTDLK